LENGDLGSQLHNLLGVELTIENAIDHLKSLDFSVDNSRDIAFIATHFHDFSESALSSLTQDALYSIVSHPQLKLESEDDLFAFISHKISMDPSNCCLFEFVHFECLTNDSIQDFIRLIEVHFEYFGLLIWQRVAVRLAMSRSFCAIDSPRYRVTETSFRFNPDTRFTGIINHLTAECHGNVHVHGVVKITASSDYSQSYTAANAADFAANSEWLSQGGENQWFCYDFQERRVDVTNYSIQSADVSGGSPRNFPAAWVLEASVDGSEWIVLDEQTGNSDLKGQSKIASFTTTSRRIAQFIRIRQTRPNHNNQHYFGFRALELFGGLSMTTGAQPLLK
jgi:hypothetical protein